MFKKNLEQKVARIFNIPKVTYDMPADETREQGVIFIKVSACRAQVHKGEEAARVTGTISIYSQKNKLPFGYIQKCIEAASNEDTKDIFFHNTDENEDYLVDLSLRTTNFVFFYKGQYDPQAGTLSEVEFEIGEY